MNSKVILLSFAVVAVGLFALPSTMSLFSGQHTWVAVEDIKCQKCHQDIYDEITGVSAIHNKFEASYGNACARCHVSPNSTNFNKSGANLSAQAWISYVSKSTTVAGQVNFSAHAAITVECLACHGTGNLTNNNTGLSTGNSPLRLMSDQEAHRPFYYAAVSNKAVGDVNFSSLQAAGIAKSDTPQWYSTGSYNQTVVQLKGTNAACIGCHTHATVNITWNRAIGYEMNANVSNAGWVVNFTGVSNTTNTTSTSGDGT
ncbi:Cytochrome c7 c [uncultured archaeon]|nr:Cytochrome c7 c [uncultured archaeon]